MNNPYLDYMHEVPIENLISFSITLFLISLFGIITNKQSNIIIVMLFIELMLYSLSFLSIVFSLMWGYPQGQIFALLIMCVAVAESSIGLGLLILIFRANKRIDLDTFSYLKS
jgi:NADH-quinone oxidoreductase subunit K